MENKNDKHSIALKWITSDSISCKYVYYTFYAGDCIEISATGHYYIFSVRDANFV